MKLILTNDDGIDAPGIKALEAAVKGFGTAIVVAPAEPNSGVGHRVTTGSPIRIDPVGDGRFRVEGTPADCARIALKIIASDSGWLLAGINRGGNLGADIYMSGTVAAVREAALLGYKAIAVSHYVARDREVDWGLAARRSTPVIRELMKHALPAGWFWNVNLPHPNGDATDLEVAFCRLDTKPHGVQYEKNGPLLTYTGDYHLRPRQPGRDVDVCLGGNIAVTRIPLEMKKPLNFISGHYLKYKKQTVFG